jgi:hypothetical protein
VAGAGLEREDRGVGHQLHVRPADLGAVRGQDDRAVHLRELEQQGGGVVDLDLQPARIEKGQLLAVPDADQSARAGLDDRIDPLPDGGAGSDHLEGPYEPGFLASLKLRDIIPGVRHEAHCTAKEPETSAFPLASAE